MARERECDLYAGFTFLDYIQTDPYYEKGSLNKRQRKATETAYREFAEENPVAASAVSVLQTPAAVTSYAGQVVNTLLDGETDPNASYNKAVYTKSAARDAVAGKIEKSLGEKWGPVGSFGYQIGIEKLIDTELFGSVFCETSDRTKRECAFVINPTVKRIKRNVCRCIASEDKRRTSPTGQRIGKKKIPHTHSRLGGIL